MSHNSVRWGGLHGAASLCAALVLLAVGAFGLVGRVNAQSASPLVGQVLNGTADAPSDRVADLAVTLFQMGTGGPVTQTIRTDARGRFSFPDIKLDQTSPFFAQVDYEGIHYFSEIVTPGIESAKPLTLTVYETQTIPSDFQIDRAHFILDSAQNALTGIEIIQVKNPTDRVFLLPLPLPDNLADLQFNDPRDQFRAVQLTAGSIAFPILPTTTQILIGVRVNSSPPENTLKLNVPVKIGRVNVLVSQAGGVQVSSPQLAPGAVFTPQSGGSYWQLSGDNIPAGSTVPIIISNLPGGDNFALVRNMVLGFGGLAAIAMLAFPFLKRRGESSPGPIVDLAGETDSSLKPGGETTGKIDAEERLARLREIADLDDAFEAGEMGESEYREERAALKAELMHDSNAEA